MAQTFQSTVLETMERGGRLLCFDVTDGERPRLVGTVCVGDRPEGLLALSHGRDMLLITGDGCKVGPGTITFTRLRVSGEAGGKRRGGEIFRNSMLVRPYLSQVLGIITSDAWTDFRVNDRNDSCVCRANK